MHYHPVPDDDSAPVTYCEDHASELSQAGDMLYLCECASGEDNGCIRCQDLAADATATQLPA